MRTIKFRGKRLDNGEWVYGSLTQSETNDKNGEPFMVSYIAPFIPVASEGGFELVKMDRVKPATIGQFTGLTDKNGKEIYEGDIIRHKDMVKPYHVIYDGHQFTPNDGFRSLSYPKHWEVVGNIHDNPELIKKGGVL